MYVVKHPFLGLGFAVSNSKGKLMAIGMNECDFVLRASVEK